MVVNKENIKLSESQNLTDEGDDGGRASGNMPTDGQVNNLFREFPGSNRQSVTCWLDRSGWFFRKEMGHQDIQITINGWDWVFMVARYDAERRFGAERYRIPGESCTRLLSAHYAPLRSKTEDSAISAIQNSHFPRTPQKHGRHLTGFPRKGHSATPTRPP